jgi:hypothetical protein
MNEELYLKSGTSKYLSRESIEENIVDIVDVALYQKLKEKFEPSARSDNSFNSNEELWHQIISNRVYFGQNIILKDFIITEWLPLSPGLFHTDEAKYSRKNASRGVVRDNRRDITRLLNPTSERIRDRVPIELDPNSKMQMVLGGIGSLRLIPKVVSGAELFFLGASSSGVCHEGIPIILNEATYEKIIFQIKENCGLIGDVIGRLKILPTEISSIEYDRKIQKYCLFVEDIKFREICPENSVYVTTAITYSKDLNHLSQKSWSFVTFNPDRRENQLRSSVEWLYDYAKRYSKADDPIILSDFDEYHNHFDKIELSLTDVTKGNIPIDKLIKYKELLNIKINVMGDYFSNISNSTIINKSKVENAFNKIKNNHDEHTAAALVTIANFVEGSNNKEAGEAFDDFNEELNKEEPKKSKLSAFWNQLSVLLPVISTTVGIADKIAKIIG